MAQAPHPDRRLRGFEPAAGLVRDQIRGAGEKRGFAVSRLLTHWDEIVGPDLGRITRPAKVGWGREGMGATLTLLVAPAAAPQVQMELPRIRDRVNATYGYAAIARIVLTQTAASGFAEGQTPFTAAPRKGGAARGAESGPDATLAARAAETAQGVKDDGLRAALQTLALNILDRRKA